MPLLHWLPRTSKSGGWDYFAVGFQCIYLLCKRPGTSLSARAAKALDDSANELASVWEIALKHHTGKLPLPSPPEVCIEEQIRLQDIAVLLHQREVLYLSRNLPKLHKNPFDRLIAAEVLHRGLRLLSPDESFVQYGCDVIW